MVERNLAKVEVASSRLVSRSSFQREADRFPFSFRSGRHFVGPHPGGVAEWLCSGLQSRGRRFDSDPRLQNARFIDVDPTEDDCPGGETGRHSGLKIRRLLERERAGSSPARGTTFPAGVR
ncbi:MAG: hypothetical protein RL322_2958 [Pseudomonadota bacterium]